MIRRWRSLPSFAAQHLARISAVSLSALTLGSPEQVLKETCWSLLRRMLASDSSKQIRLRNEAI